VTKWLLLVAAVACEVTASLALKGALDRPSLYAVVAVGYLTSLVSLTAVLQRGVPLGVAYGIWGALGVAATAVMSTLIFDESLTGVMVLGMAIVVVGVLTVELGSHAATRDQRQRAAR
jgi:small multidrug resistance pump